MVRIDSTYDVILTYSPISEITGHVFECFDYYLFLRDFFKVGILFLEGLPLEDLKIAFESKYNVPFSEVADDIIQLGHSTLENERIYQFGPKTFVLLCDGNIRSLAHRRIMLATRKLYGFMCGEYGFEEIKSNNHITYLQDFRIYGRNQFFKCYDYVKKLPFKYYKQISRERQRPPVGMMYVTYACRKVTPQVIQQYYEMSGCCKSLLVVPYKLPEYDRIDGVEQVLAPVQDFFEKFDTYIYTAVERHFDCSPRLVTECLFYKKEVLLNVNYVDIGLQTRWKDATRDIKSLELKEDDEILSIIKQSFK